MIIIGYPGIGKSTLGGSHNYIDLESSNFSKDNENWYEDYCNVAEDLSRQGFKIFVSSHEIVQKRLLNSEEDVIACFPIEKLYEEWAKRLSERFRKDPSKKNENAAMFIYKFGKTAIASLRKAGFDNVEIKSMDYNLRALIEEKILS